MSATVAPRAFCNAGKATLTTVPSMKAMLEPKIVAARIHRPTALLQGAATSFERMNASSQGGLAILTIQRSRLEIVRVVTTLIAYLTSPMKSKKFSSRPMKLRISAQDVHGVSVREYHIRVPL